MHNLLKRQIQKYIPKEFQNNAQLFDFLKSIDTAYFSFEKDKELLNHAFEMSEMEFQSINNELKAESDIRQNTIEKLRSILQQLDTEKNQIVDGEKDILKLSDIINQQIQLNLSNEQNLIQTNNLFKTLLANLQSAVLIENEHRHILFTNQLFCNLFNIPFSADEMVGLDCSKAAEQSKGLFSEPDLFVDAINLLLKNRKPIFNERLTTIDGKIFERDYIPIFIENQYKGHLWQYRDITAQINLDIMIRDKDELYRLIQDNAMDAIIIADENGCFVSWNPASEKIFGWREKDVLGRKVSDMIIPLKYREKHNAGMQRFLSSGVGKIIGQRVEITGLHADGHEFPVEIYMMNFFQKDKQFFCAFIKDISERKAQEKKLISTTQMLESILNEMTDVVYSIKLPEKQFIFITPSVNTVYELSVEQVLQDKLAWIAPIIESDKNVVREIFQKLDQKGEFNVRFKINTASGRLKWLKNKGKYIYNEDNKPIRIDGVLVDRTRQYFAQEKLDNEIKLQAALIDVATTYINLDIQELEKTIAESLEKMGMFVGADRAYIFDYDFEANTTSNTYEWCGDGISAEIDNLQNVPIPEYWVKQHLLGESFHIEDVSKLSEVEKEDGVQEALEAQGIKSLIAIPMIDGKELVGFVGFDSVKDHKIYTNKEKSLLMLFGQMLINIRNRQKWENQLIRQEEKYRNIIANMNLGLLEVDLQDTIVYANQSFCEMSGFSLFELKDSKAAELFVQDHHKKIVYDKTQIRIDGMSDSYELEVINKTGEKRWWFVSGAPNYNDKGQLIGSIGIHLDITAQKRLEIELAEAKSFAEAVAKAKELFLANMSHEIRTPLNVIIGMIRQLNKEALTEPQQFYVKQSESSARHLLTILNNVLDIAKIESGDMEILKNNFSPSTLLNNIYSIMYSQAIEKNLEFNIHIDANIHPVLIGDDIRLRQVLINLIGNSVKFTQFGHIELSATLIHEDEFNQTLRFEVSDTGIGMSKEFITRIFDKFSQEQNTSNRKFEGTGLGMAISHDLIKLMGGKMLIKSKKNEGTTCIFELMFTKSKATQLHPKSTEIKANVFKGMRALLVEDNEMNRFIAIQSLNYLGFETREAENGKIAVEEVQKNNFDIILMDIQMPTMDGVEATKYIREQLKLDIPIIALTANAFKHDIKLYLSIGMNDFIIKPYDEQEFFRKIQINISNYTNRNNIDDIDSMPQLYDLSQIKKISRGDEVFVNKIIELFIALCDENIPELERAKKNNDVDTVKKIAHKLKASVIQMGITNIYDDVILLVELDASIPFSDTSIKAIDKIILSLQNVVNDLKSKQN